MSAGTLHADVDEPVAVRRLRQRVCGDKPSYGPKGARATAEHLRGLGSLGVAVPLCVLPPLARRASALDENRRGPGQGDPRSGPLTVRGADGADRAPLRSTR